MAETRSKISFQDFQHLRLIWTHPLALKYNSDHPEQMMQKRKVQANDEGSSEDDDDDDDVDYSDLENRSTDSSYSSSDESPGPDVHRDHSSNSENAQQQQSVHTKNCEYFTSFFSLFQKA